MNTVPHTRCPFSRSNRADLLPTFALLLATASSMAWAGEVSLESGAVSVDTLPSLVAHESPIEGSGRFPGQATVELMSRFPSGKIFYTLDGSSPTTASTLYTGSFVLTQNTLLRQLAVSADGTEQTIIPPVQVQIVLDDAAYSSGAVTSEVVAVDTFPSLVAHESPIGGSGRFPGQATVELLSRFPAGKVFYTLDGSVPTTASILYTEAFVLKRDTILRQLAVSADGSQQTAVPTVHLQIVQDGAAYAASAVTSQAGSVDTYPPFKINDRDFGGESRVLSPAQVALVSRFPGGRIYYTLDGSAPTTASSLYSDPLVLTQHAVIRQLEVSADGTETMVIDRSEILPVDDDRHFPASDGSKTVRIDTFPALLANGHEVEGNIRVGDRAEVQLLSRFPGGSIFYTLDGSEPSLASTRYTGPFVVTQSVVIRQLGWSSDSQETTSLFPVLVDIFPESVDTEIPILTLTEPAAGPASTDRFQLRGTASDNVGVALVRWSWNGEDRGLLTLQEGRFEVLGLMLVSGTNVLQIQALDAAGNVGQVVREVVWTPVQLQVGNAVDVPQGQPMVLEVTAGLGTEVLLESTTDLNAWSDSQKITGQGPGKPVRVDLVQKPNETSRFWRVRVP